MKKVFLASVFASMSTLAVLSLATAPTLQAQAAPDQITIKDPAEFNAYQNAMTQTDHRAKASAIEGFLISFPQSVVKKSMLEALVDEYATFDQAKTVDAATRLLQLDPNNLKSMLYVVYIKKQQAAQAASATPPNTALQAQLLDDAAAMAVKGLAATKPAEVKAEDFTKQKAAADLVFRSTIAYDALYSKKDLKEAIADFRSELESIPPDDTKKDTALNDTLTLGTTYTRQTPPDMVNGVWFLARAENFAPASFKPVIDKQAKYWYKRFHGGEDGFDKVLSLTATSVFPTPDFTITPAPTPTDIANKFVADNPDFSTYALGDSEYVLANASKDNAEKLWATLKDQITQIPGLVISATASQLQLAVTEDAKTDKKADFTVNMKTPLTDKETPAVGATVTTLIATYDSYTQPTATAPAQIIMRDGEFQVEKKKPVARKPSAAHRPAADSSTPPKAAVSKTAASTSAKAGSAAPMTAAQKAAAKKKAAEKKAAEAKASS